MASRGASCLGTSRLQALEEKRRGSSSDSDSDSDSEKKKKKKKKKKEKKEKKKEKEKEVASEAAAEPPAVKNFFTAVVCQQPFHRRSGAVCHPLAWVAWCFVRFRPLCCILVIAG